MCSKQSSGVKGQNIQRVMMIHAGKIAKDLRAFGVVSLFGQRDVQSLNQDGSDREVV